MKIFCGGLGTETNTFSPMPTGLDDFYKHEYFPAGEYPDMKIPSNYGTLICAVRELAKTTNIELHEGLVASAAPGGVTTRRAYEKLRDELIAGVQQAQPVDIVLLNMHGAMVAEGYDDCEGDIIERIRNVVGQNTIIGVELDPHCHVSEAMLSMSDIMVLYKEYPHTDIPERGKELLDICLSIYGGKVKPAAALVDCDMIVTIHTTRSPGKDFVQKVRAMEGRESVLSISVVHGFPSGDVPDMGTKVLVYADEDTDKANEVAWDISSELKNIREELKTPFYSIDEALNDALEATGGPFIFADDSDNPGSGSPGDSTFILRRMLERGIKNSALGPVWDPMAARIAINSGEGSKLFIRLGGKTGPLSGQPIDVECVVKAVKLNHTMSGLTGAPVNMGDAALLNVSGIDVVVITQRNQAMNTDLFTGLDCDLALKKIIVVKSSQHFYASFSKISSKTKVFYVQCEGVGTSNLRLNKYRKIKKPKWPL